MIMTSFKLTKTRVLAGAFALAAVLGSGMLLRNYLTSKSTVASNEKPIGVQAAAKTNEQRLKFIEAFGWEVEEDPQEVMEVLIPGNFDDVYENYNDLQKQQGYDLLKYKGKRAKRYTYEITNYPGESEAVQINLLVYKNKIIGGDVCSVSLEGFMHGFDITTNTAISLEDLETTAPNTTTTAPEENGGVSSVPTTIPPGDQQNNPTTGPEYEELPTTAPGTAEAEDDAAAAEEEADAAERDATEAELEAQNPPGNPGTGAGVVPTAFLG